MKNLVEFVEIPAVDFSRAVKFYETVFGVQLTVFDCTPSEKMAFFPHSGPKPGLAISWAAGFLPSKDGVLVSLNVESIEAALECIRTNGGKTLRPKTKIEAEGMGYFAQFTDSEGNTLGLYADQ